MTRRVVRRGRLLWLLLPLLLQSQAGLAATKLYRYTDDRGVVSIDDHVPPEFVKNGYQVLTPNGRVIETVAPQLSDAESERKRAAQAEAKRLQEWDKSLLLRYSTVDDIAAARDRAMREFDVRISILHSNLLSIKSQIESEQSKAADLERRGVKVPDAITQAIDELRREIADTEDSIVQHTQEKEKVRAQYEKDIERFKTLKNVVEFRRRGAGDQ